MPSSIISSIAYQLAEEALIVVFLSGDTYRYEKVPEKIYKEFKASISKGNYLNRQIKKRYHSKKIS